MYPLSAVSCIPPSVVVRRPDSPGTVEVEVGQSFDRRAILCTKCRMALVFLFSLPKLLTSNNQLLSS